MCKGEWPHLLHTTCLIFGNNVWFPSLEPLGKALQTLTEIMKLFTIMNWFISYLLPALTKVLRIGLELLICTLFFLPGIKFLVKQSPLWSKAPAFPGLCVCGLSFCPIKSSVKSFGWGGLPRHGVCMLSACWEKEGFHYYMWGVGT
jgi:hypothetical protein